MRFIISMLAWVLADAVTVVGPAYPPNAVSGGSVIALLKVSAGSVVNQDILQGDEPFVAPTKSALSAWRFSSSDSGEVLVVVSFRTPRLYAAGSATRNMPPVRAPSGLPSPRRIVEPAYPPNSLGEGNVIMRLTVNAAGSVSNVNVVQGAGDLTGPSVSAARNWQFAAAQPSKENSALSEVYAVCVLRRPILTKKFNQ